VKEALLRQRDCLTSIASQSIVQSNIQLCTRTHTHGAL